MTKQFIKRNVNISRLLNKTFRYESINKIILVEIFNHILKFIIMSVIFTLHVQLIEIQLIGENKRF